MATSSIKLPETVKTRIAKVAKGLGITMHAFMVEAIDAATLAAEQRARFIADGHKARKSTLQSGAGLDADDVHAYVRARITGKRVYPPKAKSWRG